jgi:hypothetical protein
VIFHSYVRLPEGRLVVIGFDRCLTAINRTVMVDRSMLRRDKISQRSNDRPGSSDLVGTRVLFTLQN